MEFNSMEDIHKLPILGAGSFGNVYHFGEYSIKVYHPVIVLMLGAAMRNPNLKLHKRKFTRFKKRQKKVHNSNLPIDTIFIDGKFVGVVYKYIDGNTIFNKGGQLTFDERKKISLKLINNTQELTKNKIYHCDLKLDNILIDKDENVRIIDFDDRFTKVTTISNPYYLKKTLISLRDTLNSILYDANYLETRNILNYDDLECYVKKLQKKKDL